MAPSMNYNLIAKQANIAIYAIFLGSQITEGFLLVPYWQSLSAQDFYIYYAAYGPLIGRFYTILTITAALIPIVVATKYFIKKERGMSYAIISAAFSILVIICFYIYFKAANQHFYSQTFDATSLSKELIVWSYWHWSRIGLEVLSLAFLMLSFSKTSAH